VFTNDGAIDHDLTFEGQPTRAAAPGETVTFEATIPEGGTTFLCTVPGHADGGMTGTVTVGGQGGLHGMTAEEMREVDAAVTARFPEETSAHGGQPLEPEILADGTKVFELTASVIQWEITQGEFVEAWAYNEMVPGPEIRVQLGDRVRIVLHNELEVPTTLHSHGLIVPNDMDGVPAISQPALLPGESFTYEFTVRNAGSHMYHSHFMAQRQVPMGLLGAFVVEDPSEPEADIDMAMVLNDGPLGFTINGKGFPATVPIVATQGQLIRVRYMNEGLQIHPMHLHGIPQQVIARDGFLLDQPYYEDTVLVAPGQRVDVLIRASELGVWAFHCHVLSHAESDEGMFGMVTALIVTE
jgi:FtsP/CotA-like multicopper oxidase with cupredoxin domain